MAGQLIPPPELDPDSDRVLTMDQRIEAWFHLMSFGRQMFVAGAQMREGPNVDLRAAWQEQYQSWLQEHDEVLRRMFSNPARGGQDGH